MLPPFLLRPPSPNTQKQQFLELAREQELRLSSPNVFLPQHEFSITDAVHIQARPLNRYSNVLPYNRTRVRLASGRFINANWLTLPDPISAVHPSPGPSYIASQGPLPHTIGDTWQMMYQHGVPLVVMLVNVVENQAVHPYCWHVQVPIYLHWWNNNHGQVKCERYWPERVRTKLAFPEYELEVDFIEERVVSAELLQRKFCIRGPQGERSVTQLHFTGWPDHSVPRSLDAFVQLVRLSNQVHPPQLGKPMLVHCSAGVGRTGTFCVVHSLLTVYSLLLLSDGEDHPLWQDSTDWIPKLVGHFRTQRAHIVEQLPQFQFCYDALAHALKTT